MSVTHFVRMTEWYQSVVHCVLVQGGISVDWEPSDLTCGENDHLIVFVRG